MANLGQVCYGLSLHMAGIKRFGLVLSCHVASLGQFCYGLDLHVARSQKVWFGLSCQVANLGRFGLIYLL